MPSVTCVCRSFSLLFAPWMRRGWSLGVAPPWQHACDPGGAGQDCRTLCGRQGPGVRQRAAEAAYGIQHAVDSTSVARAVAAHQTAESRRSVSPVSVHAEPSACSGHPRQPETTRGCLQLNGCHAGPPTEPARQGCRAEPDQLQHIIPQPDPCPQPDFPNVREVA